MANSSGESRESRLPGPRLDPVSYFLIKQPHQPHRRFAGRQFQDRRHCGIARLDGPAIIVAGDRGGDQVHFAGVDQLVGVAVEAGGASRRWPPSRIG